MFILLSLLTLSVFLLLVLLIFNSYTTLKLINKKYLFLLFLILILFSVLTVNFGIFLTDSSNVLHAIPDGNSSNNVPMDPIRWWPTGVLQSITVVGSMVGTYVALTKLGVNPKLRVF